MNIVGSANSIESLISSEGGLHFSAYINNHLSVRTTQAQIEEALKVASEDTRSVLSRSERKEFLAPIHGLLNDPKVLFSGSHFGIFRSHKMFKVLNLPMHVDEYCTVASSFHIKPILKWIQEDRSFYLLSVDQNVCRLYSGTQYTLRHLDSLIGPKVKKIKSPVRFPRLLSSPKESRRQKVLGWLKQTIGSSLKSHDSPIFIFGSKEDHHFFLQNLAYADIRFFKKDDGIDLSAATAYARSQLKKEVERTIAIKISAFKRADALDLTETNVFKIAQAANEGLIKQLIIASDKKIFGKFSQKSGKLCIHPADIDHEDDDILDDLAQNVIRRGGDVLITPARNIPRNLPLVAISEPKDPISSYKNKKHVYRNLISNYARIGIKT